MDLPRIFLNRMQERLGEDFPAFLASYEEPPRRGLRVNTLKISAEDFFRRAPFPLGKRIPWAENAFYQDAEKPGGDVYHFAGLYYLQEPSAMCAAPMLKVRPGERVLDLCAAPGGKTTQLAADMGGAGVLVANEIDYGRAKILSQNVERMGIRNCMVTCMSPRALAEKLPGYFDKILVDAPCSGEGMFKKEPNAIPEWSEENVALCAARQREILDEAANLLAGGGEMVYSTCTFAEEEDEWQVERFLERHREFELLDQRKLYPYRAEGEGHFAALLRKKEGDRRDPKGLPETKNRAAEAFLSDHFDTLPKFRLYGCDLHTVAKSTRFYALPEEAPPLFALRCGIELGEYDGKLFKPAHALAMALGSSVKNRILLSREEAKKYLRGETVETDLGHGWCVVCVEEFPLGWGKAVDGVVKNHLPKGLRMRS